VKSLLEFSDHIPTRPRFKNTAGTQHRTEIGLKSNAHSLFPKISGYPHEKLGEASDLIVFIIIYIKIKINIFIMKIVDSIFADGAWWCSCGHIHDIWVMLVALFHTFAHVRTHHANLCIIKNKTGINT